MRPAAPVPALRVVREGRLVERETHPQYSKREAFSLNEPFVDEQHDREVYN
jgi:hypothetical protein